MSMKKFIYIVIFTLFSNVIFGQDISKQESQKARLEKEILLIDKQLRETESKSSNALNQLSLINKKVDNRKQLISVADKEIRSIDDKIYSKQREINKLSARVDTLTNHYHRLVRSAYKNRDSRIWYMYLLASEDFSQAYRRYGYFKNLSDQIKTEAVKIRETRNELEKQRQELRAMKAEQEKVRSQKQKELNALSKEQKDASTVVNQLNRNKTKYQKELAAKRKEVEALNREIKRLVEAAIASKSKGKEPAKIDYKLDAEFAKNKGKLPWPAEGPVVDRFGQHYHPVYKTLKLPFNNGVSIALSKNAPIKAVFNGVVKQIVVMPGYNQCILIQHGNYFTFYCKLKSTSVKAGDVVKTGDIIGRIDTIDSTTQLHFQVWQGTTPQNPEIWLR